VLTEMIKLIQCGFKITLLATLLAVPLFGQAVKRTPFDVTNYVMDVTLVPNERKLSATVDVTFVPLEDTRAVAFELNGSLKVDTITRQDKVLTVPPVQGNIPRGTAKTATPPASSITFVQDQTNSSDLGPHVRIDLGDNVIKGTPITLRFKYSGILDGPAGGPLLNKRLAFVGENGGYLMYAARWFPFHDYAADPAVSDISISVPGGFQLVGFSETPATTAAGKTRFVQSTPSLPGNFAYGKYMPRTMRVGDQELQFFTKPGSDALVSAYGEVLGKALDNYTKRFGAAASGKKLSVAVIDDDSLEFYSTSGMLFIANRQFEENREIMTPRLQREAAYQWWGLTVGLKSFDDAWLSQGLAEYSAFTLRESELDAAKLDALRRELLEKALTFEQTASLLRTPANLDDQSTAYQYIMYAKGAFVFKLLRDTLGAQKFDTLLRTYLQEFRGKNASLDDFEKLTTRIAIFFCTLGRGHGRSRVYERLSDIEDARR
jgi:Peptidase family M1 domain